MSPKSRNFQRLLQQMHVEWFLARHNFSHVGWVESDLPLQKAGPNIIGLLKVISLFSHYIKPSFWDVFCFFFQVFHGI